MDSPRQQCCQSSRGGYSLEYLFSAILQRFRLAFDGDIYGSWIWMADKRNLTILEIDNNIKVKLELEKGKHINYLKLHTQKDLHLISN